MATHPVGKTKSTHDAPRKEPEAPAKAKLLVKRTVQSEPSTLAAAPHVGGIQVKTLDEIRREKAARMEAQRGKQTEVRKSGDGESCSGKSSRLLLVKKTASPSKNPVHTILLYGPVVLNCRNLKANTVFPQY